MNENNENSKVPLSTGDQPLKFARAIIWVGVAQIITAFLGLITLPALTKSYSPEIYGIWAQSNVTVSLLNSVLTLEFGIAVVRFLAGEEDKTVRRRSLGSMLSAMFIVACLIGITIYFFGSQISVFLFDNANYVNIVYLTFLWTLAESLFMFSISFLRARGRIKGFSIILILFSLSKVVTIVLLAQRGSDLLWIIGCLVLIEFTFALAVFLKIFREEGFPKPNLFRIKDFLAFSVPNIPCVVLVWIISSSDRYFITHFLDLSSTGIYSSSNNLGSLISLFYSPISFVLLPALSKAWEQKRLADVKNYFEYSTRLFLLLAVPGAAGLAALSQPLLKILTTSDYLVGWELVLLVSVGTIFLGIFQINLYAVYLVKKTQWLPLMIAAASVTNIIINFLLIPRIGIIAAAISNMISYLILAAIVTYWASKYVSYRFDAKFLGKLIIASAIMFVGLYFSKVNGVVGILLAIIIGIIAYFGLILLLRTFSEKDRQSVKQLFIRKASNKNDISQ